MSGIIVTATEAIKAKKMYTQSDIWLEKNHNLSLEKIKQKSAKWRNANAEEKSLLIGEWARMFELGSHVAFRFNISLKAVFGTPDENSCPHCHGTGFFKKVKKFHVIQTECPNCLGYGFSLTICKKCQGKGDPNCPVCKGSGIYLYYKAPCSICGMISPTGDRVKGTGVIMRSMPEFVFTPCNNCGGWGTLNPKQNPLLQDNQQFVANPRIAD